MITKKQIREIESFNLATLNEALKLAEQRLNDALKTKEDLDKKSFSLLTIFLSLSATFFSLPQIFKTFESALYWSLIIAGFLFLIGVIALLFCLWPKKYGTIGRYPDTFLQEGIINNDDNMLGYVMANILYDYQESIEISVTSNEERIKLFKIGIISGIIATISIIFIPFFWYLKTFFFNYSGRWDIWSVDNFRIILINLT